MKRPLVDVALDTALSTVKIMKKADDHSSSLVRETASELTDVLRKKQGSELRNLRDNVNTLTDFLKRRPLISLTIGGILLLGLVILRTRRSAPATWVNYRGL